MKRVKLNFANQQVEFVDRDLALKLIEEWAGKGTYRCRSFMVLRVVVSLLGLGSLWCCLGSLVLRSFTLTQSIGRFLPSSVWLVSG